MDRRERGNTSVVFALGFALAPRAQPIGQIVGAVLVAGGAARVGVQGTVAR